MGVGYYQPRHPIERRKNHPMINTDDFVTVREAAGLIGYTAEYIRRLCRDDRLEHVKIGPIVMVNRESLLAFKASQDARREEFAAKKADAPTE
jgi:excisionase family DNA binding protein